MATLEQLVSEIYGAPAQAEIKAENPYYTLAAAPNAVTKALFDIAQPRVTKEGDFYSPQFSTSEVLPYSIGAGLLSGLMQGLGNDYQNTLSDRYLQVVDTGETDGYLPSALFGSAGRQRQLFGLTRAIDLQNLQDQVDKSAQLIDMQLGKQLKFADQASANELKNKIATAIVENPAETQRAIPMLREMGLFGNGGARPIALPTGPNGTPEEYEATDFSSPVATAIPSASEREGNQLGLKPMKDRRGELFEEYRAQGFNRGDAAKAADHDLKADIEVNQKGVQKLGNIRDKAQEMISMADTVDSILDAGLSTGWGANVGQTAAKIGSAVGIGTDRATLGDLMNSQKAKSIVAARPPGVGAMSDPEMRMYIQSGPSLDKTPEANREIARRMRQIGERSRDYADFVDTVIEMGGTVRKADALWSNYERANPLFVKKGAKMIPNPNIVPYTEFDFESGAALGQRQVGASGSWDSADSSGSAGRYQPTGKVTKSGQRIVIDTQTGQEGVLE